MPITLCLVSKIGIVRLSEVNMVAAGDRTRPLRYCVIRSLSSVSRHLAGKFEPADVLESLEKEALI